MNRRSIINHIFALALILFMIGIQAACRLLEKRPANDKFCFAVSVYDDQKGVNNELKHVELCSRSAPFTWEIGDIKKTSACSDCQITQVHHVSIDKLPVQFKVNGTEFTLTETSLKGGGKDWSLAGRPILNIDVDELLRSKHQ